MSIALDTNVLVYTEEIRRVPTDAPKIVLALRLIEMMARLLQRPVVAVQSLAELHRVLVRKRGLAASAAAVFVERWRRSCQVVATDEAVFAAALELAADHQLQIYDAIIFAAAVQTRCDLLLSEDLQDGFTWRGVTVVNPFAAKLDSRLQKLLA